jgi:hypothetical protein
VGLLIAGSAACEPDNSVKPGAPELIQFTIVQGGMTATTVKSDTPDCDTAIKTSDACNPEMDGLCRLASADNWCTCVADSPETTTMGTWNCDPFANVTAVIAVFDRLLDTAPFEPGDAPVTGVMTTGATPAVPIAADYSATGDQNGLLFNFFGPLFFGNFRADGPSLFGVADPEFPSGMKVSVSLQADKVHAKDGKTPYKGSGQLQGGTLIFTMAPFTAAILPPDLTPMTMDPITVTVAFTNMAPNPKAHVTAKANGAPIAVDVTGDDGSSTFAVTPVGGGPWPAGATIEISMDATAQNLLGQMLAAAPDPLTFTAP